MDSNTALKKLIEGNQRYVDLISNNKDLVLSVDTEKMANDQKPFAIILGCSDSRAPTELIFHQSVGDLFIIRVAGNIATPSQIGSVEFACQNFGTELVIVLGHSKCGAIKATVNALQNDPGDVSPNIAAIVEGVTPAIHPLVESGEYSDQTELIKQATRANVEQSVAGLQSQSDVLRNLISKGKLRVVGAQYDLATGKVEFYTH